MRGRGEGERWGCSRDEEWGMKWSETQRGKEGRKERMEGRREDTFLGIGSPHLVPIATQPSMKYWLVPPSISLPPSISNYIYTHRERKLAAATYAVIRAPQRCQTHQKAPNIPSMCCTTQQPICAAAITLAASRDRLKIFSQTTKEHGFNMCISGMMVPAVVLLLQLLKAATALQRPLVTVNTQKLLYLDRYPSKTTVPSL